MGSQEADPNRFPTVLTDQNAVFLGFWQSGAARWLCIPAKVGRASRLKMEFRDSLNKILS